MTDDRGLSIFEEKTAEADEPTQVIPRVEPADEKPAQESAQKPTEAQ